ncbi:MAG: hypothetical protein ACLP3K_04165 [Candidatus Acidiferrales bacterium]
MSGINDGTSIVHQFRVAQIVSIVPSESRSEIRFRNYYQCPADGTKWTDEWSCMCNDRCPVCGDEIMPYESENI